MPLICVGMVICSVERERERDPRVQKQEKRPHATEEEDNHYKSWGKKAQNYDLLVNVLPLCH